MLQICSMTACTGCSACYNICGSNAISMIEDNAGFIKPLINQDKCVNCGRCINVCPVNNDLPLNLPIESYACHAKNVEEQLSSTSGGVASVVSRYFIENDGVVYGSMMDTNYKAYHTRVCNIKDLFFLKGSKYVQSKIDLIYKEVRKDLINNKNVLFIGTPCQVSGLKFYLSKEYENLYTIDFVCHGVPSQKILDGAISCLKKSKNLEGTCLQFRYKIKHANLIDQLYKSKSDIYNLKYKSVYALHFIDNQGVVRYSEKYPFSKYMSGFLSALFYRESCYTCRYATPQRVSDLTCGDFMESEIEKLLVGGFRIVSMLSANTNKGKTLFNRIKDRLEFIEVDYSKVVECHNQLHHPMPINTKRKIFIEYFEKYGFEKAMNISFKKEQKTQIKYYYKQAVKHYLLKLPMFSFVFNLIKR